MRLNKRMALAAASAVVVGSGLIATAGPADAGTSGTCASGYFCVYIDGNFDGAQYSVANASGYTNMPPSFHDQCSSWVNHTTRNWNVYDNAGRTILQTVAVNQAVSSVPSGTNDKCDSVGPA